MTIKLVVGLQNPGTKYAPTRHNAGGWFVAALAEQHNQMFNTNKPFFSELSKLDADSCSIYAALPTVYMNESGRAVRSICQFYKIKPEEVLIAHDDLDLPVGTVRLKTGGGHGGHNGLRDIIAQLGSRDFHRLRIGIGHPGHKSEVHDYVLHKPSVQDKKAIDTAVINALHVMPDVLQGKLANAMKTLHTESKES